MEYKTLSNYQFHLIEQLSDRQIIEVIELYDEMLSGIADLIGYIPITTLQREYLHKLSHKNKRLLIELYNQTVEEINQLLTT